MITFGVTMQGREDAVPRDVFEWLMERNEKYPNAQFQVNVLPLVKGEQEINQDEALKYAMIYMKVAPLRGVETVIFPYVGEMWNIRILGLENKNGEILHPESEEYYEGLAFPPLKRFEIAGVPMTQPTGLEFCFKHGLGVPRKESESMPAEPKEMVAVIPDARYTSALSMSGKEFSDLMTDKKTRDEAAQAFYKKDWETLKRLRKTASK